MKIGDLAEKVGIRVETIRFYEQKGLIPEPTRTSGNFRDYSESHVNRLTMIRHCRALDMSHEEIQELLKTIDQPDGSCLRVNSILDEHIAHVAQRIDDLKALERTLGDLRSRCSSPATMEDCGIVQRLSSTSHHSPRKSARSPSFLSHWADTASR